MALVVDEGELAIQSVRRCLCCSVFAVLAYSHSIPHLFIWAGDKKRKGYPRIQVRPSLGVEGTLDLLAV